MWFWLFILCYVIAGIEKLYSRRGKISIIGNRKLMACAMVACLLFWWLWDFGEWIVE